MPALKLFISNRLEVLADKLADELRTPLSSPLTKDIIVIQSKGMERWVSMHLARRHGICANFRLPFPNAFLYEIFREVLQDLPEDSLFTHDVMTWKIMKILPLCMEGPAFESLRVYLSQEERDLRRFQLSEQIADLFDQYLVFRPEMILEWQKGKENHWQAVLWKKLVEGQEENHRASIRKIFFEAIQKPSVKITDFPERISVFGISALPQFHLEVIGALSQFIQVNLFLMNPCKEYWADIVSDRQAGKIGLRYDTNDSIREALHLDKGNSLLASMGMLGRDFFSLVHELDCEEYPFYEEPGETNLLSSIQSDILNLRERGERQEGRRIIAEQDSSIQVHSCHSPMREIEVLHDNLLALFAADPDLMPKDILVMTPDIETYAPFMHAVFDSVTDNSQKISFSIADRSIKNEGQIIEPFLAILDLWNGRMSAPEVMAILESSAVRLKFGLSEADVALMGRWVKETCIRWGVDGQSRSKMGLPGFSENTWQVGLERLLLGYAMPGGEEQLFRDILPYDHIEGGEARILGKFLEFTDQLFGTVTSLSQLRTLDEWLKVLVDMLEGFFEPPEDAEREVQFIRRTFNDLAARKEQAGFDEHVGVEIIEAYLTQQFQKEDDGRGFITGGITFSAMLPLRSIPFKVLCLVGMNDEAYPRPSKSLSFDMMALKPRRGDRSRKNDDRYLFLEALLSARNTLYISYVGQSIQDNSLIPPSVLVSELIDYIEQGFTHPTEANIQGHIVKKHRLQAFNPEYFKNDGKLFSYSEENYRAALRFCETRESPVPFISRGLPAPAPELKTVDIDQLCSLFANPAKFLLTTRLQIYLKEDTSVLEDREPFTLKGLELYSLAQMLLEKILAGGHPGDLFSTTKSSGRLPHGTVGQSLYKSLLRELEHFAKRIQNYQAGNLLEALEIDLDVSGFKLRGRLSRIYAGGLIRYHYRPRIEGNYGDLRPQDHLRAWIHHLALNSMQTCNYPATTILIGRSTAWKYGSLENAKEILEQLLSRYWQGLSIPLHFFPKSSEKYAEAVFDKKESEPDALRRAEILWEGSEAWRGESQNPYYQRCFDKASPLDSEFVSITEEIFGPLMHSRERIE
jgi:exodeoxyribonuclease V gamma subunit